MAWIEFHAAKIKRLKKSHAFRKQVGWSVLEALGFLGSFWGEAIEVCESGEVTGWTPDYLAEITGLKENLAERVWNELLGYEWIDRMSDERLLIHHWLDYAGLYLTRKYASSNRDKLVEIWSVHGRVYGEQKENSKKTESKSTEPNQTLPNQKSILVNFDENQMRTLKTEIAKAMGHGLFSQANEIATRELLGKIQSRKSLLKNPFAYAMQVAKNLKNGEPVRS